MWKLNLKTPDQVTSVLPEMHWLPATATVNYKRLHMLEYIKQLLTTTANISAQSSLCASMTSDFVMPQIGDRAFSVAVLRDFYQNLNHCNVL